MNRYIVQDGEFMLVEPIKVKIPPEEIVEELNDVIERMYAVENENIDLKLELEMLRIELKNAKPELNLKWGDNKDV